MGACLLQNGQTWAVKLNEPYHRSTLGAVVLPLNLSTELSTELSTGLSTICRHICRQFYRFSAFANQAVEYFEVDPVKLAVIALRDNLYMVNLQIILSLYKLL